MSGDFLANLAIFGPETTPRSSPGALAEPFCPDCVTFIAGPPGGALHGDVTGPPWASATGTPDDSSAMGDGEAWLADGSPLAHLFAPGTSLRIEWESAADPGPAPSPDDEDRYYAYTRAFAAARFARRVLDGDTHAWAEALASYRERFRLPGQVRSTVRPEEDGSLRIAVELPGSDSVPTRRGDTRSELRARYLDLCAGTLLAFACDAFRVLPSAADSLYLVGYRKETDPATGHGRYAVLLRLATDRASLEALDLSRATPSAAFEYLGGAARKEKDELVALAHETEFARVL